MFGPVRRGVTRRHWALIAAILLLAAGAAGLSLAGSRPAPRARVTVTVTDQPVGRVMPTGYLGFSIEYNALQQYLGRRPNAINPLFLRLVQALNPAGAPVLRIGGDSTDHTWWPLPGVVPPAGVDYALTPDWLATTRAAAAQLGARLILGINLAAASPALAAAEARALLAGIGRRYIRALEIGNEPDLYTDFAWFHSAGGRPAFARRPGWSARGFTADFRRWAAALPRLSLAGPAYAYRYWMGSLRAFVATAPRLAMVTFHRYPLRGCGPLAAAGPLTPTVTHLLAPAASAGLARSVRADVLVAHAAGLPFRVDELNSASCGGARGLSNTFASALWMLDTLFNLAAVGVDGVNIHTWAGAAYAPFRFRARNGVWHAEVEPDFYGMLLFSQAFPAGAHLLATRVRAPAAVRVWVTRDRGGTVRTVVINDGAVAAPVRLALPGAPREPVRLEALTAPSLTATDGVRLGGQSFGPDTTSAALAAAHLRTLTPRSGAYRVRVPANSALLLTAAAG